MIDCILLFLAGFVAGGIICGAFILGAVRSMEQVLADAAKENRKWR